MRNGVSDEVFTLLAEWKQTKNDVRHGQHDFFFFKWGDADEAQGAVLQKQVGRVCVCVCFLFVFILFP